MELDKIIALIKNGVDQNNQRQVWADLGAGSGAFTKALSTLLIEKSKIYAVDIDIQMMNQISINKTIELVKLCQSFTEELPFDELLNGIILANSLHYIQDKASLIESLRDKLITNRRVIIVEYDLTHGNQWVPFPIHFNALKALATQVGFKNVVKLAEIPSQYHRSIYSAMLT